MARQIPHLKFFYISFLVNMFRKKVVSFYMGVGEDRPPPSVPFQESHRQAGLDLVFLSV